MIGHDEHLAHDSHQGITGFHAAPDQAPGVGTKGRGRQTDGAQRSQVEHPQHPSAAAFGELDLPFPLAALPDLEVQTGIGYDLIDAPKARHIAQLGAQHGDGLAPKLGRALSAPLSPGDFRPTATPDAPVLGRSGVLSSGEPAPAGSR